MQRLTWVCVLVAAGAVFVLHTLGALATHPWDDALFFKRFALNTIEHGVAAWNVEDGPVHGNTSQLFQLIATAVVAVTPDHFATATRILLGCALLATFFLLAALVSLLLPRDQVAHDRGPHAVLLCALSAPTLVLFIGTGMETTVALFALSGLLLLLARLERRALGPAWLETILFAGGHALVYLARPDVSIIAFLATAVLLYERGLAPWRQLRLIRVTAASLCAVLLVLLLLRAYYGTAFPLSFYLKNHYFSTFDEESRLLDSLVKRRNLVTWLAMAAPLLLVALFRRDRWNIALLAAAAAFVGYHFASTVEIMGFHARFYAPALVPVSLAAARGWPAFAASRSWRLVPIFAVLYPLACATAYRREWLEPHKGDFYLSRIRPEHYEWYVAAALVLLLAPLVTRIRPLAVGVVVPLLVLAGAALSNPPGRWRAPDDRALVDEMARRLNAVRGALEVKACLSEPLHIYHSEIGVTGLLFIRSRVTDLSGLMNRRIVFERTPFDEYCLTDPPEVLFLPHLTYKRLNREIERSRCLAQFARPRDIPRSQSTLYLRRDLVAAFDRCTAARRVGRSPGT